MTLLDTLAQTQAALSGAPPAGNPLVPPEAPAAAVALPPGFENGPAGMRVIAPPGYQYNAANALEVIPPPPPVAAAPLAPPPLPEQPPVEAAKKKGRGASKTAKVEDVIDLLIASENPAISTLTVAQVKAIRDVVEAA